MGGGYKGGGVYMVAGDRCRRVHASAIAVSVAGDGLLDALGPPPTHPAPPPAIGQLEAHQREATHSSAALRQHCQQESQRLLKVIAGIAASFGRAGPGSCFLCHALSLPLPLPSGTGRPAPNVEGERLLAKKTALLGDREDQSQLEGLEAVRRQGGPPSPSGGQQPFFMFGADLMFSWVPFLTKTFESVCANNARFFSRS